MKTAHTITIVRTSFTGYFARIATKGKPAISTIRKHLSNAKARDCQSVTIIEVDEIRHDLVDLGAGSILTPY